jgi:bifunctional non-homologous end joining protein LigD
LPIPKIIPMPLAQLHASFEHRDWPFEVKYDGFRALAHRERGTLRLLSRKENAYKSFPALCRSLGGCLSVSDAVLDEIVCLGPHGKPRGSPI